jgi:WD40 repeat protein
MGRGRRAAGDRRTRWRAQVWVPDTGSRRNNWKLGATIWELACRPDGWLLAAASRPGVRFFDLARAEEVQGLTVTGADVTCVAFAPDGRSLAAGCDDGSVRFFDVRRSGNGCIRLGPW